MTDLVPLPDGRRLQVWRCGPDTGPAVLFLPGCPDSRLVARGAATAGVRLIALNRPGYGASTVTASGHLSVADDVAAVADALTLHRYAVLGMSLGGPYALACAARHPDRVTAVGLVAAPAPPGPDSPTRRTEAELLAMPGDFARFVAGLNPADPDDTALASRWCAIEPALAGQPVDVLAASAREALSRPDGYLRDAEATFRPWAFDPRSVTAAVQLWYGAHDTNAVTANGHWYADHLPDARLTVDPATGHLDTLLTRWPQILTALT